MVNTNDGLQGRRPVHVPVMVREVIEFLDLQPGQTVIDGTVGAAGHSRVIIKRIEQNGTLIGLDRDPMMLKLAALALEESNVILRQASYNEISHVLNEIAQTENIDLHRKRASDAICAIKADRILLDLGLSSDQLADDSRGFSWNATGALDMRFDTSAAEPAWRLLETIDESELADVLWEFGEERHSRAIARRIVAQRKTHPIRTAADLVDAVANAIPQSPRRRSDKHPATRVFQALRIVVNDELKHLKQALETDLHDALTPDGRLVVLTFHSLEDRMIKQAFRGAKWQTLTPKPLTATANERRMNPRSRSAKLRAAIKR